MSVNGEEVKGTRRSSPESFGRKSPQRRYDLYQKNRNLSQGDRFIPDTSNYTVDRQTSTTDFYLYSRALRDGNQDMSNHVLGSRYENYNQQRPEALDGYPQERPRSLPPAIPEAQERRQNRQPQYEESPRYNTEPRSFQGQEKIPPRPQYYGDSPRRDYEQRSYRAGRPDIGVQRETYVPYPQEPIRRSRHDYEQPPDIGFDPYKDDAKPKYEESEEGSEVGPHPGWILLLRFNKQGEDQVRKALTFAGQINKDGGAVLGIARPYGISIKEGGDGWLTFGRMIYYQGGRREIQQSPIKEDTNYCVLAIYYPSIRKAQEWFDRDSWFKQKDFPYPYATDCIALPLSTTIDPRHAKTLVMTEYPKISDPERFRENFSVPTEKLMRSKYRATPYFVKAFSIATDDPNQRVARHFRGCWIKRNSIITLSAFESLADCQRYFKDAEYLRYKASQDQVSAPTTVIFDLESAGHY